VAELVRGIPPKWVGERIGVSDFGDCETMGIIEDGKIVVGLAWCEYKKDLGSISMCLAIDTQRVITKGIMKQVFSYAFDYLGVRRITNTCSINNAKAQMINLRAGFKKEGLMRQAYHDGSDMLVFGMLREDCRYL
jgi:hypothetical protein